MLDQRRRRWADVVQMLLVFCVFDVKWSVLLDRQETEGYFTESVTTETFSNYYQIISFF